MSIYATTAHPPSKLVAKRAGGAKLSRAMRDRKLLGNEQHVRFAKNVVVRARPFRSVSDGRFRALPSSHAGSPRALRDPVINRLVMACQLIFPASRRIDLPPEVRRCELFA